MSIIKFPWEVEEKEEEKSVIKFEWDKPIIEGLPMSKPEDKPGGATITTLPSQSRIQSLSLKEDYERKTLEQEGISQRMRGIGEVPKQYSLEGVTTDLSEATKMRNSLWWNELKTTEDKGQFLKQENWSPELKQADIEVQKLSEEASKLGVNINDWVEYGVYSAFFTAMAASILPVLSQLPANILNNISYKVEGKTVKGPELMKALRRVNYEGAPGIGKPSIFDKKVFAKLIEEGGLQGIGGSLKKGITITEVVPRFAFGGKLYSGLPIDEMVKSIVEVGKLTQDIANQLKVMNPADTALVFQELSLVSPAIASKLASQFVDLVPQKITKIPKAGEGMTPEEAEQLERLKETKIIPEEEIEPTKAELKEIELTAKEEFMVEMEKAKEKVEVKEPTIELAPTEQYKVPTTLAEAKEILKVDPKKPSVPKEKLAEQMVANKISIADIEAVKGLKIDVKEPKDIFIALRDIKAVKKEVVVEPTPKVEPVIPAELKGLAEEGDPAIDALQRVGEAHSRADRNKIIIEAERLSGGDRTKGMQLEKDLKKQALKDKTIAQNDLYEALEPKYHIGDVVEIEAKGLMKKRKVKIENAVFKTGMSAQQMLQTGFPSSFAFDNLTGTDVVTGEKNVPIYPSFLVNGEILSTTIKRKSEDVLKQMRGAGRPIEPIQEQIVAPDIENDYKLIDKWIKANTPKVSVSGHGGLKEVSEQIRKGNVPTDVLEAMHRQFEKTKDQETGEMLWWDDTINDPTAYPRTGTLMDFYNAYENLDLITKAPVKTVQALAPKVEPKVEVKIDLATPTQIKKAHAIADTKALISEKGKMKPQYRKIAEVFTGKKSIKDMTPEEAEMFIDMLDRLPEPKYRNGKLIAPSIPRTMKLTTQDFFKKQYGEPTPIWLLTDQTYYATQLGIHPLVEPFEKGRQKFDLEFRKSSNLVDRMADKLNQVSKTPGFERIKSKFKNIPTKAESKMAELVNKHETTPPGLSEKEEDVFKYFRNLSKDIWRRENEVREKVDLPPIKYKQAYFRHTADAMAKEMLEGKYPFPQGIKYWSEKMVGKKIFNPMEFHRKLSDDLMDIWSKDIRAVTKAMLWNGLKEIHLAQPAKFLNEQLNAISKDLPEYKNLSPRDQAAYDQTKVMPASTKKYLINYVNQVLKGQETELDASLNRIVTKSGLKGIFDKVLSPFGRAVGRTPITNLFTFVGRDIIWGVMGWVPRQIIRNSFQPVQNLALYGVKATIKAYLPASVDKNLVGLMSESLFRKSYTGFEELPADLMGKVEKVWLGPYQIIATNNAKLGMKAAYWDTLDLIKNPKYKKNKWRDPQRTKDTPEDYLYPIEEEYLSREMEFGASATQYQYIPMGMPGIFRYKALIPLTRLQSWWMNYFTKFLREATHRALKGRPSWSGEDGPTLPWSRRVNFLKYVIIGGAILTSLGYKKSFMLGVAPTYLSPAGQVALGFYNYATATEDWQRKRALNQIYYSWKAFIPGSLAWRDFMAVWNGEKELNEILFYGKEEAKKPSKKISTIEFDWDKETKPKSVIKFDWD